MDNLKEIVSREVRAYAGKGLNGVAYFLQNENQDVFAVVDIAKFRGQHIAESGLIVRLINDQVVIEQDTNSKPLVDALLQAGVSREKIVLTYAGEIIENAETIKP